MEADNKTKVRAFYSELQGYLSQAPNPEGSRTIYEASIWDQHNGVVSLLSKETGREITVDSCSSLDPQVFREQQSNFCLQVSTVRN